MEHAQDGGRAWRATLGTWIRQELGHLVFDPAQVSERRLRRFGVRGRFGELKRTHPDRYDHIVRRLVEGDLRTLANRCDYVVCYWDTSAAKGAGTQGEVTVARFLGKPVYLVSARPRHVIPVWILGCTTRFFPSFTLLKKFLLDTYQFS